jgi:DNA-binding beta-propeller fold protein YncE
MPTTVNGAITSPLQPITTISLAGLVPPRNDTPTLKYLPPFAYSIGVDSDTNHAVVAYSSSSNPTTALVGFLLDLNPGFNDCIATAQQAPATVSPCVSGQVSMTTGLYPQIAMLPHTHSAVVTPGGLGSTASIDVLHSSKSVGIKNVSLASGLVTVVTSADHGLNPVTPGTVLIANVPAGTTNQVDFNGPFVVQSVINSTTFTYALAQTVNDTATGGAVFYGNPNLSVGGLAQTTQGIAVNPITGVVAAADANATGQSAQINMLSSLDQGFSSVFFHATSTGGCTFYTTSCAGAPELLGTTSVAFQPFANLLVSYNGPQNQLSVSDPVTRQRYAWVQLNPVPTAANPVFTSVVPMANTGFTADIALNGGLAVDAATNQAVVTNSSAGTVTLVALGPTSSVATIKPVHVTEVLVPSAAPSDPFTQGGIPGANFPQGTQTSATDLVGVKIFGSGFSGSGTTVQLDGTAVPSPTVVSDREIDVTIPASFLAVPHHYALDVVSGGATSNASDFFVVKVVDLSVVCKDTSGNPAAKPASVAIADQLGLGSYAPQAIVSNSGCNNVSVIDIAPQLPTFLPTGQFDKFVDNANFGKFFNLTTGSSPSGVAVSPRFGLAVVANNGAGTASILDIVNEKQAVPDVTTGGGPIGVAINEGTGAALVANTQQNTVSEINLGLLFPPVTTPATTPPTTLTATSIGVDTAPIAIAIDPDRGTNNNGLAVVTALALTSNSPRGVLDAVDIGSTSPAKSTSAQAGQVTLTPTGIVFDPSVSPALFYAVSSGGNLVTSFNPDTGGGASGARVGINPTSLALNPQTGGIITVNTLNNTISIVDTLSSPFKTRRSFGLPGPPPVGTSINQLQTNQVAIDQFLNMAVIVDQAHNRVLLFPIPN